MLVHAPTWPKNENFGGEDGVGSGAPAIYLKDLMTACHNNSDQEVAQSLESICFGSFCHKFAPRKNPVTGSKWSA